MRKLYDFIFSYAINVFNNILVYDISMNIEQRRVLRFRFIASFLLLMPIGMMIFSLLQIIVNRPNEFVLSVIALAACGLFNLFEIIVIMKGWTKESNLLKIFYDEAQKVNTIPLVSVFVGTLFGLVLTILGIVVWFTKADDINARTSILVILTIGTYLLTNCLVYYLFIFMYRKRKFDIRDFIK